MKIKDLMNHPAVTCPDSGSLDHAARLMWEFDCGVLPVVDANGCITGMVTDRDICMAAYTQGRALREIPITSAMARKVIAAHSDDAVDTVQQLMRDYQIRRLPVIDDGHRPVGVVALNDLARLAARVHKSAVDRELVQTLAAVCQPHGRTRTDTPARPVVKH